MEPRVPDFRQHLQDDVVAVDWHEVLRHPALTKGIVQCVVDELKARTEPGGLIGRRHCQGRASGLLIGSNLLDRVGRS